MHFEFGCRLDPNSNCSHVKNLELDFVMFEENEKNGSYLYLKAILDIAKGISSTAIFNNMANSLYFQEELQTIEFARTMVYGGCLQHSKN